MSRTRLALAWTIAAFLAVIIPCAAVASGFGQGVFGANVPFGSATSIAINLGSNVAIPLSANGSTFSGSSSHTVTVTSTDVVGYMLYVHPTTTTNMTMTGSSATIGASSNVVAGPLSVGSWGYNLDGSSNFLGLPAAGALLKETAGPYTSGDPTTITYGALTNASQPAGSYTVAVTYTAVAKNP